MRQSHRLHEVGKSSRLGSGASCSLIRLRKKRTTFRLLLEDRNGAPTPTVPTSSSSIFRRRTKERKEGKEHPCVISGRSFGWKALSPTFQALPEKKGRRAIVSQRKIEASRAHWKQVSACFNYTVSVRGKKEGEKKRSALASSPLKIRCW